MDSRVKKDFLISQWQAALATETLSDCRQGPCHQCGVCDFKELKPVRFQEEPAGEKLCRNENTPTEAFQPVELIYSKRDEARFFGHLEVATIFARALRRARIDVLYSQGFHPMPRISFDDPLPLGMESCGERLVIRVTAHVACRDLVDGLSTQLPQGLNIIACRPFDKTVARGGANPIDHYRIFAPAHLCPDERIELFRQSTEWPYSRRRKERTREIDLKSIVVGFERVDQEVLELSIRRKEAFSVRPHDVLRSVFDLDAGKLALLRVLKLAPAMPGHS
jgi:radical SAM-linked protein